MRRAFLRDERANAAVEFAIIVPVLFTLILGIISTAALYFSESSLHQAAEWTARYWAVSDSGWTISSTCNFTAPSGSSGLSLPVGATSGTSCDVATAGYSKPTVYAKAHYYGVALTGLTFTPTTGQCTASGSTFGSPGVIVSATGTYNFNAMFVNIPVTLKTQACYPLIQ